MSTVDRAPYLALVAQEVQRVADQARDHVPGEVDGARHRHSRHVGTRRSVLGLVAVVAVADHGDMARHRDLRECAGADCCDVCSFRDDRTDLPQAEARRGQLACHRAQRQLVHHYVWHKPKPLVPQIVLSIAPQVSDRHSRSRCELHQLRQGRPTIVP